MLHSRSETFEIINALGLHARAAATFVKISSTFRCNIDVIKDSITVNGKSIMGVLMLAAAKGSQITIRAEGSDANTAIEALGKLINDKFGEEE